MDSRPNRRNKVAFSIFQISPPQCRRDFDLPFEKKMVFFEKAYKKLFIFCVNYV